MKITSYISNLPRLFETWLVAYIVCTFLKYISLDLVVKSQTTCITIYRHFMFCYVSVEFVATLNRQPCSKT